MGGTTYWMFCFNATPVSFEFLSSYPAGGNHTGNYSNGQLHWDAGASPSFTPANTDDLIQVGDFAEVRNLAGTWTDQGGVANITIVAGSNPFEYSFQRAAPGFTTVSGRLKVDYLDGDNQRVLKYTTSSTNALGVPHLPGELDLTDGSLYLSLIHI